MTDSFVVTFPNPTEILVNGPKELKTWREQNTVAVPGAKFTPAYRLRRWDGNYSPGKWCRPRAGGATYDFRGSRGLLRRLTAAFLLGPVETHAGFNDRIKEMIAAWWPTQDHSTLRDYQVDAIHIALTAQWGRFALATNAGKGAIIALLAEFGVVHKLGVLILCDELAVFDALKGELSEWTGKTPELVVSGVKDVPSGLLTLAMVPTLVRRLSETNEYDKPTPAALKWREWLSTKGMVLLDEADKATAPTWRTILMHATNSHWRLGFSGSFPSPTAEPYADLRLDELMGPVLARVKNVELIERHISARPHITLAGFDVTTTVAHPPGAWWGLAGPERRAWVYDHAVLQNDARHQYIASLIQEGEPTALVVNRIEHGHALAAAIRGSVFLDGSADENTRADVLNDFQAGRFHVLIVTKILDRGTNRLGHTASLLFVSGEGSARQTLQRIGRGLRRAGGKEFLRLVDIIDRVTVPPGSNKTAKNVAALLHSAAKKRIEVYREEEFDVSIEPAPPQDE